MFNFAETSDQFLLTLADMLNIKVNQIKTKDNFVGKMKNGYYIINLDDVTGPGTHWTCMRCIDDIVLYFDSFGLPPPKDIVKFGRKRKIIYSADQIQDIMSEACGYYVLDFMHFFNQYKDKDLNTAVKIGHKLTKYLLPYDSNVREGNEKVLSDRIKKILN